MRAHSGRSRAHLALSTERVLFQTSEGVVYGPGQSDIVSVFKFARMCITGSRILQCELSGGKQKWTA